MKIAAQGTREAITQRETQADEAIRVRRASELEVEADEAVGGSGEVQDAEPVLIRRSGELLDRMPGVKR